MKENPFIGKIAHNFSEMKRISEASRPYEGTGEGIQWRILHDHQIIYTNL